MSKQFLLFIAGAAAAAMICSCAGFSFGKHPGPVTYFVKADGSDRNDGLSEDKPFRSLFKAMAAAMKAKNQVKTITVIGTLDINSEQSSNRERVFLVQGMGNIPVLIRGKSSDADPAVLSAAESGRRVVMVKGTVPVRFEDIEISGGVSSGEGGGGLVIGPGSTVTLGPGAVIRGNQSNGIGGGALVAFGGSFFIDGGKIIDNRSAASGGGVAVAGQNSVLAVLNGEISGNHAQGGGGAAVYQGGHLTLSGRGVINGNTADLAGGGVMVNQSGEFTMKGGLIRDNQSSGSGGGVALMEQSAFVMEDGEIQGNRAAEHGGGIAADHTGVITLRGGFISANRAETWGGGVFTAGAFVKSAGKIYGSDMPKDAANVAASGAAVFVYRDGLRKIRDISAGDDLVLDAAVDDGWNLTEN